MTVLRSMRSTQTTAAMLGGRRSHERSARRSGRGTRYLGVSHRSSYGHGPARPPRPRAVQAAKGRLRRQPRAAAAGCSRSSTQLDAAADGALPRRRRALTGYFLEGGVRDNAVTAGTLARRSRRVYRAAVPIGRAARRDARLLRNLEQQALQQRDVRHARRRRAADPSRASQGFPADVRAVRRGAVRRARTRGARVRHAVGTRRDARLRGRVAQHDGDDRRARRRADHLRLRGAAGARRRGPRPTTFPGRRA